MSPRLNCKMCMCVCELSQGLYSLYGRRADCLPLQDMCAQRGGTANCLRHGKKKKIKDCDNFEGAGKLLKC